MSHVCGGMSAASVQWLCCRPIFPASSRLKNRAVHFPHRHPHIPILRPRSTQADQLISICNPIIQTTLKTCLVTATTTTKAMVNPPPAGNNRFSLTIISSNLLMEGRTDSHPGNMVSHPANNTVSLSTASLPPRDTVMPPLEATNVKCPSKYYLFHIVRSSLVLMEKNWTFMQRSIQPRLPAADTGPL